MILKVKINNFLSFHEETVFDMFPNLKRTTFPNHVYSDLKVPLLKQAAIYGANGSGKSNFLKAIKLIKEIAINKNALKNYSISQIKFRFANDNSNEPICFYIDFFIKGKYFIFSFEVGEDKI